jgi:hypothetical protein
MSTLSTQLILGSPGTNWTNIILIAIFAVGLVAVILIPFTLDVRNAHRSWLTLASKDSEAVKNLDGPRGIQGLARATMALGLLVAVGFALAYIVVVHPFSDNKTIVTAIVTALTTALASAIAFYFSTRAMQGAQQQQSLQEQQPPQAAPTAPPEPQPNPGLVVTITTPADGSTFALNEVANADFSAAPAAGAELTQLDGTLPNGAPIDTTAAGLYSFTVSAKDSAGNTKETTTQYTVA